MPFARPTMGVIADLLPSQFNKGSSPSTPTTDCFLLVLWRSYHVSNAGLWSEGMQSNGWLMPQRYL